MRESSGGYSKGSDGGAGAGLEQEAMRGLSRARRDMKAQEQRARQRLNAVVLGWRTIGPRPRRAGPKRTPTG